MPRREPLVWPVRTPFCELHDMVNPDLSLHLRSQVESMPTTSCALSAAAATRPEMRLSPNKP